VRVVKDRVAVSDHSPVILTDETEVLSKIALRYQITATRLRCGSSTALSKIALRYQITALWTA